MNQDVVEYQEPRENSVAMQPQPADDIMPVDEVVKQLQAIQECMRRVMKEGVDYGTIPGCGDKPALFLSGAQKLALLFKLIPDYERTVEPLDNGHKEITTVCKLYTRSGDFVGSGIGSGTTMESKYRYRTQDTGRPIPQEYWKSKDPSILGGPQFSPKKKKNQWTIHERIENDNIADTYNTVLKMSKKRAYVDSVITRTAASHLFTQDIEDMVGDDMNVKEHFDEPVLNDVPPPPDNMETAKPKAKPKKEQPQQPSPQDIDECLQLIKASLTASQSFREENDGLPEDRQILDDETLSRLICLYASSINRAIDRGFTKNVTERMESFIMAFFTWYKKSMENADLA